MPLTRSLLSTSLACGYSLLGLPMDNGTSRLREELHECIDRDPSSLCWQSQLS